MQQQFPQSKQKRVEVRSVTGRTQSGGEDRVLNLLGAGDLQGLPIQKRASTQISRIELFKERIINHPNNRDFLNEQANGDRDERIAMHLVCIVYMFICVDIDGTET